MNLLPIVRNARAEDDLIAIWLHNARDNEAAADRLLDRFEARWHGHRNIEADDLGS